MAPGKKNPPLPNLADDARRRDPEKGSRDDGKDSPEDSPRDSPPPPPPRRARSRGGRAPPTPVETVGAKTSSKDSDAASGADASLHWGVRKMRGADPSNRLFPTARNASNRPVERNPTPTPAPRRSNPESVGFESLLQLADAGVQLEKRRSGAAAAAARRRARADADAQTRARKHAENSSKRVAAPTVAGKRRGRGPNKVQETEEEREAKRLRRVQANRESARQTIRRKHEMYDDLSGRAGELEKTNKCLREEVATLFGEMRALAATNASLRDDIKTAARAKGVPEPDVGDGAAAKEAAAATARNPDVLADASGRAAAAATIAVETMGTPVVKAKGTPAKAPITAGPPSFSAPIPGAAAMPAMPGAPVWPPFPGLAFAPGPVSGPVSGPGPVSGGPAPTNPYFVNGAPLAFFHPAAMAAAGFAGWSAPTTTGTPPTGPGPTSRPLPGTDDAPTTEMKKVAAAAAARMERRAKVSSASK